MNDSLDTTTRRLTQARRSGDADDLAEALALHANALVQAGKISTAQQELDEAATIHRTRGRVYDEARCTQFAASLCRFAGHLDEAKLRANRALELIESNGPIAVSAHAELGEIALAEGNSAKAAQAYGAALEAGEATGLVDSARAALLRKRATALTIAAKYQDAVHDLATAHDLLVRSGDHATALRTLIEQATALRHADQPMDAEPIVRRAMDLAGQAGDHAALADLHLLLAARALDQRDAGSAMAAAQAAREHALAGNAPTPYIGATHAIAQLAEATGDRLRAYEALATGWATISDLLGGDAARMSFEPTLREVRKRWGVPAFDEIKKTYEENRRATR